MSSHNEIALVSGVKANFPLAQTRFWRSEAKAKASHVSYSAFVWKFRCPHFIGEYTKNEKTSQSNHQ